MYGLIAEVSGRNEADPVSQALDGMLEVLSQPSDSGRLGKLNCERAASFFRQLLQGPFVAPTVAQSSVPRSSSKSPKAPKDKQTRRGVRRGNTAPTLQTIHPQAGACVSSFCKAAVAMTEASIVA